MEQQVFQAYYPDDTAHCYGCGRLNESGLQIKSCWETPGEISLALFTPRPYHTAIPGYVYGGLLASLIDCHSTGTAAAAAYHAQGRPFDSQPPLRFVTAALNVDFIKPTPLGPVLEVRGRALEVGERKVVVEAWITAAGVVTVRGRTVCVLLPPDLAGS